MAALREIGEHPVSLGDGERGLERRQRRRELPRRASAPRSSRSLLCSAVALPVLSRVRASVIPANPLAAAAKAGTSKKGTARIRKNGKKWKAGPTTKSRNNPPATSPTGNLGRKPLP